MFYLLLIFAFALGAPIPALGQADYRNLDPGRPISIEDAQPIEFRAFEFQLGIPRYSRGEGGGGALSVEPELKWGFAKDWQAGVSGELIRLRDDGAARRFRETQIHFFYNLNQEGRALPAISFRPELTVGTGARGSEKPHGTLKGIMSKSVGTGRIHLNGAYTAGPTEGSDHGEGGASRYLYGIAFERTFPLAFVALLTGLSVQKPISAAPPEMIGDLGARLQLTPTWVLDVGIFTGLRNGPDFGWTVGLSHVFSFRSLFPTEGMKGERS